MSAVCISGSSHNVCLGLLLDSDHLGDEFGVVAEIGVHDNNEVAGGVFQTMNIGRSQTKLTLTGFEDNVFRAIELLELLRDLEGAVRGSVVNDNNLPIQLPRIEKRMLILAYFRLNWN